MSAARPLSAPPDPAEIDHFVYLRVGWDDYETLLAMRGESSVPRITYLNGVVELEGRVAKRLGCRDALRFTRAVFDDDESGPG